jgi:hypothetical protein
VLFSLGRNLGWFSLAVHASSHLNARMLCSVLNAKLSFFHQTPTGRILNVFSKDQGSVDEQLPAVCPSDSATLFLIFTLSHSHLLSHHHNVHR